MLDAASQLRFCRLLGYTRHIRVIRMVRERLYNCDSIYHITSAKDIPRYTMYYKVLQSITKYYKE